MWENIYRECPSQHRTPLWLASSSESGRGLFLETGGAQCGSWGRHRTSWEPIHLGGNSIDLKNRPKRAPKGFLKRICVQWNAWIFILPAQTNAHKSARKIAQKYTQIIAKVYWIASQSWKWSQCVCTEKCSCFPSPCQSSRCSVLRWTCEPCELTPGESRNRQGSCQSVNGEKIILILSIWSILNASYGQLEPFLMQSWCTQYSHLIQSLQWGTMAGLRTVRTRSKGEVTLWNGTSTWTWTP